MAKTDIFFKIHTKEHGPIIAEYATSDPYTVTRGGRARLQVWIPEENILTVTSDTTIPSEKAWVFSDITIDGATLTVEGSLQADTINVINSGSINVDGGTVNTSDIDAFAELLDYGDFAGSFSTNTTLSGIELYNEQTPTARDTLLIGIEPATKIQNNDLSGVWGLVDNIREVRDKTLTTQTIEIELRVIAEYNQFADHAAIEADRKI